MSDMKCPFCNGELVGTIGHPICRNQDCVMCDETMPKELLDLLERTRKVLEIAVDALKYANKCIKGGCVNWETEIDKALNKITALEQKD